MDSIKKQLNELKDKTKKAIINLAKQDCVVEVGGLQIRQSFSYYEEEVYHVDKAYIHPNKGMVRIQIIEYADSIELSEFSIEDQIGIFEELEKTFMNPKYEYRIDYY